MSASLQHRGSVELREPGVRPGFAVAPAPADQRPHCEVPAIPLGEGREHGSGIGAVDLVRFAWDSGIEAYTRQSGHGPAAVDETAGRLRELGHYVFSAHMPLPRKG